MRQQDNGIFMVAVNIMVIRKAGRFDIVEQQGIVTVFTAIKNSIIAADLLK